MKFFAVDVETANASRGSICQLGLVHVQNSEISSIWSQIVDPGCSFDPFNTSIHGISPEHVSGQPVLRDGLGMMLDRIGSDSTVVSHSAFDRVAIERAADEAGIILPPIRWLDSAKVSRRAWREQCGKSGYGLKDVCHLLEINFTHHDAAEDARAAALIIVRAGQELGVTLDELVSLSHRALTPYSRSDIAQTGCQDGEWAGRCIVFTGTLSMLRRDAAVLAASFGFDVADSISKKVSHLVLGDRDVEAYGTDKSGKQTKAEKLIAGGHPLQILSESDFLRLVRLTAPEKQA